MIKNSIEECLPSPDPTDHPDYTEAEVQALRRVHAGTADARQQGLFFDYILRACGKDDQSFRPESKRLSDFAEGKRSVALNLLWMLKSAQTRTDPDKISARSIGEQGG